jgi:uncharacterized protein YciI
MKAVLSYDVAALALLKVPLHLAAHRARQDEFHKRGVLLMAGAYSNPMQGALAIFTDRAAAEEFAKNDPFVLNGIVAKWTVQDWNELLVK